MLSPMLSHMLALHRRRARTGGTPATLISPPPQAGLAGQDEHVERLEQVRRAAEFADLVTAFAQQYRDMGAGPAALEDPIQPPDLRPSPRVSARAADRWQMVTCLQTLGGLAGTIAGAIGAVDGGASWWYAGVAGTVAATGAVGAWWAEGAASQAWRRAQPLKPRLLLSRKDVVEAYTAYADTVPRLRALGVSEMVVAGIEEQSGYAVDLLHEAARLHTAGASASREADAVRDTLVAMTAHARAVLHLAERQHKEMVATAAADPLLLGRAPDLTALAALSHVMADEDIAVRGALSAAASAASRPART